MELLQIKYFKVIADTENITKASQQLFIAQPSLSQTLKRLEDELGVQLFDRSGKKITLNNAGKIFLKYCNEILAALENAQNELDEYKGAEICDVNIEVKSASLLIPEIIERICSAGSHIMPRIFQSHCDEMQLKIFSDIPDIKTSAELLMCEPIGVVMPSCHNLATADKITLNDLAKCSFISLSKDCCLYNIITHFCEKASFSQNISMYIDSPSLMRELLKMNFGVAFVPQYTWHNFYSKDLVFKAVYDMPMSRGVYLAMNERKYHTDAVKVCHDTIVRYFKEYTEQFNSIL